MSKLFDALQKIQAQETAPRQEEPAATPRTARRTGRFFPFLVGLTIIVAVVAATTFFPTIKQALFQAPETGGPHQTAAPAQPEPAQPPAAGPAALPKSHVGHGRVDELNNHAVALYEQGDSWTALYYFDQASKQAPDQPEPLINMAVVLLQMDLGFPAGRLFSQAYQLAPDNDHLLQAMELAIAEQVLPPDFFETLPIPAGEGN